MKHARTALVCLAAAAILFGVTSVSSADRVARPQCVEVHSAQPDPVDVTGTYDSNWGIVHLTQSGQTVTGRYECCGGGTITGTIVDGVIEYRWDQPAMSGNGVWAVPHSPGRLIGTWGTGGSDVDGGGWNLQLRSGAGSVAAIAL